MITQNFKMKIVDIVISNIKNEMKRQNMKQHMFAEKMGYGNVHMSNMLRQKKGGADSFSFMEKAAEVLGVPISNLLLLNESCDQYVYLKDLDGNISPIAFRADWIIQFGSGEFFVEPMPDESMFPTLKMRDMLLIKKCNSLLHNGIYMFRHDNNISVRRVTIQLNNQIIVNADNSLIPPAAMSKNELCASLLGQVVLLNRLC